MGRTILRSPVKSKFGFDRIKVNNLSKWESLNIEASGARAKLILSPDGGKTQYLFKVPKYGAFEAQTEIFNSILANELQLLHTQYYPGYFPDLGHGVFCKRFLDDQSELWEMKELICRYTRQPNLADKMGRDDEVLKEHNVDYIVLVLDHEFTAAVLPKFFEMVGFDALIGHGDRHWSNYGVVISSRGNNVTTSFSPIYDTASGYLLEHPEEKVLSLLNGDLLDPKWYRPTKLKGLCKITVPNNIKSNHFDLLEYAIAEKDLSRYKSSIQKAFLNYHPRICRAVLNRFFPDLSLTRRETIEKILSMRWKLGCEILGIERGEE